MNGIDPLLTTFVSYCVRGAQQRRADVWKWLFDSLFHPHDLSLCVASPWECHASLLYFKLFQQVLFVFGFFFLKKKKKAHTKLLSAPSCYKRYSRPRHGSQVQCNLAYPNLCSGSYKWPNIVQTWSTAAWTREFWGEAQKAIQAQSHGGIFSVCIGRGQKAYNIP